MVIKAIEFEFCGDMQRCEINKFGVTSIKSAKRAGDGWYIPVHEVWVGDKIKYEIRRPSVIEFAE